jgi:hypothetical protein
MVTSGQLEFGTVNIFTKFFLEQALYLEKIDESTTSIIYRKYFNEKGNSEFEVNLTLYQNFIFDQEKHPEYEELENKTYQTFLQYLKDLGY